MRTKILLCLKTSWCVAALMILLVGTNVCVSTDKACSAASDTLLFFMLLLTFPTGVIFLLLSTIAFDGAGGHYPSDYIFAWFIMACGGCLQWFIVIPRLFDKPRFTIIDLKPVQVPAPAIAPVSIPTSQLLPTPTPNSDVRPVAKVKRSRAPKRRNRVVPFDCRGRTPLERVIDR